MAKRSSDWVEALAVIAGAAVVGGLAIYAVTGRDPVEEQIDKLVAMLNRNFGKSWGGLATTLIKSALGATLSADLLALVDVVHRVEGYGTQQGWTGLQKRSSAVATLAAAV